MACTMNAGYEFGVSRQDLASRLEQIAAQLRSESPFIVLKGFTSGSEAFEDDFTRHWISVQYCEKDRVVGL